MASSGNRLNYAVIVALLTLALAPFILTLSYLIPAALVGVVSRQSQNYADQDDPSSYSVEHRLTPSERRDADQVLVLKLVPVAAVLLSAALGLLLWGMSRSTTSNLLAQMGARLAGQDGPEAEAARSLDKLSQTIGLPPPKLYVVQCSFPTTFSASTDVRNSLVAVTSGALELLDPGEMAALLAHELTHIVNHDSRLDSLLASIAVITEYPFRMFHSQWTSGGYHKVNLRQKLALVEMMLSPLGLYILVVSPLLNRLITALVLRDRELQADASAATLTLNPEVLANALAKIGGVTAVLQRSSFSSLPAQSSLAQRIEHLTELHPALAFNGLAEAIGKGKKFASERPGMKDEKPWLPGAEQHTAALNQGNVMGLVYRLESSEPVPVFDKQGPQPLVMARIKPGSLIVVFDNPGKMRQVNTGDEVFGYISRDVKLTPVPGVLPHEVYDPKARAAAEQALASSPVPAAPQPRSSNGLTRQHLWIALGFGTVVFTGMTILLFVFAGH